nr:MAG TPA: Transcriptional activator RinB [Caudoviricetes sp.]
MIKHILKDLFLIAMYELGKYLTSLLIIKLESEDDIDTAPNDYALETDQYDLNRIKAEVSEEWFWYIGYL